MSRQRLESLREQIASCMQRDRFALTRDLSKIKLGDESSESRLNIIAERIEKSHRIAQLRQEQLPKPIYADPLPVLEKREEIKKLIVDNQVIVLCGETGSGKTTQLPKICLELGRGVHGWIGHTQPRRIAARSVSYRIAQELQSSVGQFVGYKVRFTDQVSDQTYIKVMTDGILLAELSNDRFLDGYDTLIIDEAHERSLNIDFILGYLKRVLAKRKDLKVIVTSATIDPEKFSRHFNNAPIIEVSGRTYPVDIVYRSPQSYGEDVTLHDAVVHAVDEVATIDNGDVLVFLPTERDIRETQEALRKHHPPHTEILPLFARLSTQDQNKIFQPHGGRRIVLSTNVAETSLTVPGIRFVIDSGFARVSRYSYRTKIQRLPIEPISKASAKQRSGRCGRVSAGICVRLYEQSDFEARDEFTDPEILRTNLASVILQMLTLGIGNINDFPFVDPPDEKQISDGYKLLFELGAVDSHDRVTEIGRTLAKLPIDPSLGRMLIEANRLGCLHEVLVIVSALSVQDPRERPMDAQEKADFAHQRYNDEKSDFQGLLKLWQHVEDRMQHLSQSKFRQLCKTEFLSYTRVREWHDVYQQLRKQVTDLNMRLNQEPPSYQALHSALLTGLLANIGFRGGAEFEYLGARQNKFYMFPGSGLFKKQPKWIIAAEIVETSRVYARISAALEPEWIERYASHLLKRHYFEPHWEQNSAKVAGYERVTLYGLTIVAKRRVDYGRVDPTLSRELFIRHALVYGEYETSSKFFKHNWDLIESLQVVEHKQRRRDMVVDEHRLYDFYDAKIPEGITSGAEFEQWLKTEIEKNPNALQLTEKDLLGDQSLPDSRTQYPDSMMVRGHKIPLSYQFKPGEPDDGVTATIPLDLLFHFHPTDFDRLVPGLIKEKIVLLIKSLPKSLRRNFIPANEYADACLEAVSNETEPLVVSLQNRLFRMSGVKIETVDWKPEELPPHFNMRFCVQDENGKELAVSRDLNALQQQLKVKAGKAVASNSDSEYSRANITNWDFDELPEQVEIDRNGRKILCYPGLADNGSSADIRLFMTKAESALQTRSGLLRLYRLALAQQFKYLQKSLPDIKKLCVSYSTIGTCDELIASIVQRAAITVFEDDFDMVRSRAAFEQSIEKGRTQLIPAANKICGLLAATLADYTQVAKDLSNYSHASFSRCIEDVEQQLGKLFEPEFVAKTPLIWLQQYPKYIKAIHKRLQKLKQSPEKDRSLVEPIEKLIKSVDALKQEAKSEQPAIERLYWLIEELRVSTFAQELKTIEPVSVKRVEQSIEQVKKELRSQPQFK